MKKTSKKILSVFLIMSFSIFITALAKAAESVSFVKTVKLGKEIRNDYTGFVGMKIKVGKKDVQITKLGRYFEKSNKQSHELQIVDHKTNKILGSVIIDLSKGNADKTGFKYATLKTPVTLKADMEYDIMSMETMNGNQWYGRTSGNMANIMVTNVAQVLAQIYGPKPPFTVASNTANQTYGPVNFIY